MSSLSQRHREVLAVGLADLYRRVGSLKSLLAMTERNRVESEYVDDLTDVERKRIDEQLSRLRRELLEVAQRYDIPFQLGRRSLRQTLMADLSLLRVAVDDLGARRLKSYGPLTAEAVGELERLQQELHQRLELLIAELRQGRPSVDAEE